jgi:hypothetical protein
VRCHVRTGRWKREEEPPPEPDAEGTLLVEGAAGEDGITFVPSDPAFYWHDESSWLHILIKPGLALVFKVGDCLLAGVDAGGTLTDIWMLGLELALE